jgi:hypothetical protein|tara:strand:- start:217 stop:414 length:198 start_codon:yes stop_codon:yes gene_type:complete
MTDKAALNKETCALFQGVFSHLDLEYPIPVEDILSHDLFTEEQIAILVSEGFLCTDSLDSSPPMS